MKRSDSIVDTFCRAGILGSILSCGFLYLKLAGTLSWSYWWVFAPLWIGTGIISLGIGTILLGLYLFRKMYCE